MPDRIEIKNVYVTPPVRTTERDSNRGLWSPCYSTSHAGDQGLSPAQSRVVWTGGVAFAIAFT